MTPSISVKALADSRSHEDGADVVASRDTLRAALVKPRAVHRELIGVLLAANGKLTEDKLRDALAAQVLSPGTRLGELLLSTNKITDDDLYRALSAQFAIPYVRLGGFDVDAEALAKVPQEVIRTYCALPLMQHQGHLVVAMRDPSDSEVLRTLTVVAGLSIVPVLATPNDIDVAIATHCPPFDDSALLAEAERVGRDRGESQEQLSAERLAQKQPIVRLVSNILYDAIRRCASDIHIRPREHKAQILYRIDGTLVRVREFSRDLLPVIAARVKVIAGMDVAEHRLPQDGAIHLKAGERSVDLRVSIMPSIYGENVVIRVLDRSVGLRRIAGIGFTAADERRFRNLINRNQGLVLVTGPTGSGKTTTLYAAMQELNTGEEHILTVEDPVEYRLDGIVQTQVNAAIDYNFSNALRHILRHDPDVVLIGEIRDAETARIAMESALTGHVVMSTLHTNSATQTITRLLQMGVAPYLLNATLAGVLAQRLVRRNCEHCKAPETVDAAIRDSLGVKGDEPFFRGKGCDRCNGTGFRGRIAVYELLEMSPALRALVRASSTDDELRDQAIRDGMVPLTQQALGLARTGQISLLDVFRARLE